MTLMQDGFDHENLFMKTDPYSVVVRKEKEYFCQSGQVEIAVGNAPDMTQKKNRNMIMAVVNDFETNR